MDPRIGVGIGVFVFDAQGSFLLGLRKGSIGAGTWGLPGGHLDFGESFEECAAREVKEETGLDVLEPRFLYATESTFQEKGKQYVTVWIGCRAAEDAVAVVTEPEKCECWTWNSWNDFRKECEMKFSGNEGRQFFLPMESLVRKIPKGVDIWDEYQRVGSLDKV